MTDYRVQVVVDPAGAVTGSRTVERSLGRVETAADRVRRTLGRAFAFFTAGAGLSAGIRLIADFEQQMSTVAAITGATTDQFAALREEAQRLGDTTRFSASQAAEGMQFLARAGFEVDEILESVDDTLLLAQAGALGLGRAADIASNILTGFRLEAAEASRVVDVLALASNSANTNVEQLGEAMKFVAPVAAGLGVSVEEAAAAVSALSDAGLQGSLAGTGLRRVLSELESPASKTREILSELGLSAEEVRPSTVGLTAAIEALARAGVDTGTALEIFGDRGGPAFEVLQNAIPRVKELTSEFENAEGTAAELARIMDDNLNGALLSVRSALEGFILQLSEASGGTNFLKDAAFALADGIRFLSRNIEDVVRVLGAAGLAGAILLTASAVRVLNAAIIANPIGAAIRLFVVAAAAVVAFADEINVASEGFLSLADFARAAFDVVSRGVQQVVAAFQVFTQATGSAIDGFRERFPLISAAFDGVVQSFITGVQKFPQVVALIIDSVVGLFFGGYEALVQATENVGVAIVNGFRAALEKVSEFFLNLINGIIRGYNSLVEFFGGEAVPEIVGSPELARAEASGRSLGEAFGEGFQRSTFATDIVNASGQIGADVASAIQAQAAVNAIPENLLDGLVDLSTLPGAGTGTTTTTTTETETDATRTNLGGGGTGRSAASVNEANEALDRQANLLREINGGQADLVQKEQDLIDLMSSGAISAEQFTEAMRSLNVEVTSLDNTISGGLQNGLARIAERANDLGSAMSDFVVNAFDDATNAIVEFAKTGEFNVRQFFASLAEQLLRIATNQLFSSLLGGLFGGGGFGGAGGGIGGLLGGLFGFQNGGSFNVGGAGGTDSQLVAFRATPGEEVNIRTPGQVAAGMGGGGGPTNVNQNTTNVAAVLSPQDITNVLDTSEGETTIINLLQRNATTVQQIARG